MSQFMLLIHGTWLFLVQNSPFLVGFILPPFIELLNKDVPNDKERLFVSCLVCFAVAGLLKWNDLQTGNAADIAKWWGLVFSESYVIFKLYFANSGLRYWLQDIIGTTKVESKTPLEHPFQ